MPNFKWDTSKLSIKVDSRKTLVDEDYSEYDIEFWADVKLNELYGTLRRRDGFVSRGKLEFNETLESVPLPSGHKREGMAHAKELFLKGVYQTLYSLYEAHCQTDDHRDDFLRMLGMNEPVEEATHER